MGKIVNGADTDNTLWHQPEGPGLEALAEGFRHLGLADDHALLQGAYVTLRLPLLLASGLKAGSDLALWSLFRHTPDSGSGSQKNE